ncbi:DUF1800 domain-containing protein [Ideonella sp.]|uniref:DUF1800 domain-containing protein n=1 Tax=Ideonella sp. TaxID=1929293 RepID=UPI003BB81068
MVGSSVNKESRPGRTGARPSLLVLLLATSSLLIACGGGGDASPGSSNGSGTGTASEAGNGNAESTPSTPEAGSDSGLVGAAGGGLSGVQATTTAPTRADAFRLLTQATFGPTEADLTRVTQLGLAGWLDEQLAKPAVAVHAARWQADTAALNANASASRRFAGADSIVSSFYQQALQGNDQVRQRVAYALSQIIVVSTADLQGARTESVASWMDMLNRNALGNFRTLLDEAATHPAMGQYLSHLNNVKDDPATGRTPDQNFARELMQLFTIGLVQLNADGSPRLDSQGKPAETYGTTDILGMARVFTGYGWAGTDPKALAPWSIGNSFATDRMNRPMQAYPNLHSTQEKRFLGTVIASSGVPDTAGDRKKALDLLFAHPNVGPFIGRQLIQRLVTSHPSPAYVQRVATVFNNNGKGVRGDLKAVVRSILMDNEARSGSLAAGDAYGKVREPVLRLTALLRAYPTRSLSGRVLVAPGSDPANSLGQSPLGSPSVFNFYRPGYVPPGAEAAQRKLTLPEMQITTETSVAGYANTMLNVLGNGAGVRITVSGTQRHDLQTDYSADLALAANPTALAKKAADRLITGTPPTGLLNEVAAGVSSVALPALKANGSNRAAVDAAKLNRVRTALLLTVVSPEFIVQK